MIKPEPGEKIIKVVRRHWFVMLPITIMMVILALAPTILLISYPHLPSLPAEMVTTIDDFVNHWGSFAYPLWLLILWVSFFVSWTDYYLDLWIISDRKIVDVEQKGFFHREVTSLSYSKIQDITIETRGIIQTLFNYGTLHVQTAGESREIIISDASHPEQVRQQILTLAGQTPEL